jgi:hypothetical protein
MFESIKHRVVAKLEQNDTVRTYAGIFCVGLIGGLIVTIITTIFIVPTDPQPRPSASHTLFVGLFQAIFILAKTLFDFVSISITIFFSSRTFLVVVLLSGPVSLLIFLVIVPRAGQYFPAPIPQQAGTPIILQPHPQTSPASPIKT